MEPLTHFLTGACLSRAGFNRRTAYATLAMTLAAEAPDLDMLWAFRGPVAALEHHRGITHTFLGAPFVALAVTGTVYLWHRLRNRKDAGAPASRFWDVGARTHKFRVPDLNPSLAHTSPQAKLVPHLALLPHRRAQPSPPRLHQQLRTPPHSSPSIPAGMPGTSSPSTSR